MTHAHRSSCKVLSDCNVTGIYFERISNFTKIRPLRAEMFQVDRQIHTHTHARTRTHTHTFHTFIKCITKTG